MQGRGDDGFSWESPSSNRNPLNPGNLLFAVDVTHGAVVTNSLLRGLAELWWELCADGLLYCRAVFVPHILQEGMGMSPALELLGKLWHGAGVC